MDLKIIPQEEQIKDDIPLRSLKDKPKVQVEYEAEKKELSKNIQAFDKRPKVYTENPFSYNSISLKKKESYIPTVQASEMISNPSYNLIGKFLGVDTIHDWNREFNKVYAIAEWAKKKAQTDDPTKLIKWIGRQVHRVPNVGNKNLDNLFIFAKLNLK